MKPTIAYFVFGAKNYGGASAQALKLAENMQNFRFLIFSIEDSDFKRESISENTTIVRLPNNYVKSFSHIVKLQREFKCQIVHIHGLVGLGILAASLLKLPTVLKTTLLGRDDFHSLEKQNFWRFILLKPLLKRIRYNIVLSKELLKINSDYLHHEQMRLIPNGVIIPEKAVDKKELHFCTVGLICPRKKTDLAISFFLQNFAELDGSKLFVAGPNNVDGAFGEGCREYYEKCTSLVPREYSDKIIFTGMLEPTALQDVYETSLGFISFSTSEGLPNALLESMAANCVPIVGEMKGVAREVIPSEKFGLVLEDCSSKVSLHQIEAISKSQAPYQRVREAYSISMIAKRYEELYESLL